MHRHSMIRAAAFVVAVVVFTGCGYNKPLPAPPTDTHAQAAKASIAAPMWLDQGWTADQANQFYYTPQGSQLVPYAWFLALEDHDSQMLFRDNSHMERLGYIIEPPSPRNPDGLPVGFVRGTGDSAEWLGLTCAACHTSELRHAGKTFRVDGGAAMVDHETFVRDMSNALDATQHDDAKFSRFAHRVLGTAYSDASAAKLRTDLAATTAAIQQGVKINAAPHPYGFARLDAFGAIFNQVVEVALDIPANHGASDAPVSFPFLWDAPQLDWVQWNGSVANPIGRNVGEVMGVYGHFVLSATPPADQFSSSASIQNLHQLEQQLAQLSAPKWPEKELGAIDHQKAAAGQKLYEQTCQNCHFVRDANGSFPMTKPNQFGKSFIRIVMVPVQTIGTDPMMVKNFVRMADPGVLRPFLDAADRDKPQMPAATLLGVADGGVITRSLAEMQPPLTDAQKLALVGFRDPSVGPPNPIAYKARPLDGVWATAPFLHAGSVPTLYQLLLPAKERVKTFYVGSREFDPVDVGFSTKAFAGGFEFQTEDAQGNPIPGNANTGHEGLYYTQLRDGNTNRDFTVAERRELIEYLKTLR